MTFQFEPTPTKYAFRDVLPNPNGTRFAITTGPGGATVTAAANVVNAFESLGFDLAKAAETIRPPTKSVALKKICRSQDDGTYSLVDAVGGPWKALASVVSVPAGRFTKLAAIGGELLDLVFLGEEPYRTARDEQIYDAALIVARAERLQGRDLTRFNHIVCRLILLRHGISNSAPPNL